MSSGMYPSYSRKHHRPNSYCRNSLRKRMFQQTPLDANHLSEITCLKFAFASPTESACLDENLEMNQTQIPPHSYDFVQRLKTVQDPLLQSMVSYLVVICENLCSCALKTSTPANCAVTRGGSEMRNYDPVMILHFVRQVHRLILRNSNTQLPQLIVLLDSLVTIESS